MAANRLWEECLDLSGLPDDKKPVVEQTLNWLATHFPEFNEMMYDIREGQKKGQLKKIRIEKATNTSYDQNEDILNLDFGASYYLGKDLQLHSFSLNETIAHELEHAVQKTKANYNIRGKATHEISVKIAPTYTALKDYLQKKGVDTANFGQLPYTSYLKLASPETRKELDPAILRDPEFKRLAQNWLTAFKASADSGLPAEDEAMRKENILRQLLGKSPREAYADTDLLYHEMERLGGELVVYTASPQEIRAQGEKTWPVSSKTPLYPMIHGEAGVLKGTIAQMQRDWDKKWHADIQNISPEEWRAIEKVKATLLSPEVLATITPQAKEKADAIIKQLKHDFNRTGDNDVLSPSSQSALTKNGMGNLAQQLSKKGWHLD